jgi:gamma-glutamyltranspeptidase / glutathione hydrolase
VRLTRAVAWVLIVTCGVACFSTGHDSYRDGLVQPEAGVVVCEHPLATAAGLEVLDAGGNAADAAVATALALAVVYPQAGNLGGGGFVVWAPSGGSPATLDFRERAPAGYEARLYLDEAGEVVRERSVSTPLAVGVPGSPAGLFELYRRFGSRHLSFEELCAPALRLAKQGFEVDPWLARGLATGSARRRLEADPAARALFYPGGEPLEAGTLLRQPDLARTLTRYARGGPDGFYRGETARAILSALRAADERMGGVTRGGDMLPSDLTGYEVIERAPQTGWFRGHEVIGMGPPSSGGVVLLQVLKILDGFPLDDERERTLDDIELGVHPVGDGSGLSARALHWWIEALRCAFADRAEHLGDPDFTQVPLSRLLGDGWIGERRMQIGERANPDLAPMAQAPAHESSQTTHLSVLDRKGNGVSLTTTLNGSFGSGILVPGAGFLLNNELDDFSIRAGTPNMYGLVGSAANQLAPGKRPLSSMSPTVVRDDRGRVVLVLGAPGGPRIITAVTQVLLRVLVLGQGLEAAVAAPRLHQQWRPTETSFEGEFDPELVARLVEVHGHEAKIIEGGAFGSIQAIAVAPDGSVVGVSDPRRGGVAGVQGRPLPAARPPTVRR